MDVKAVVKRFWAVRAEEFDTEADHVLHTEAQYQAWLGLLGRFCGTVPAKVADVGCGTGFLAFLYAELGHEVVGIDLAPEMIAIARRKAREQGLPVRFEVGDAEGAAGLEGSFDLVVARHLMWTLPEPDRAVREWLRMLRPDGRIVLIEGHWGIGDLTGDYGEIHDQLPFFGGEPGDGLAAFLREMGVADVAVEPLMDPVLWHEPPKYPRYVVSGRKQAD